MGSGILHPVWVVKHLPPGISLGARPALNHARFDRLRRQVLLVDCNPGVNGVIRLDGDDDSISDSYLKNTRIEAMIRAGGVPDDI